MAEPRDGDEAAEAKETAAAVPDAAAPPRDWKAWRAGVTDQALDWWERVDPYVSVLFFAGGFAWDALTLLRIDRLADNLLLLAYLVALAAALVFEVRVDRRPDRFGWLGEHRGWITYGAQFFFGGLLSAEIVLYAKSASPLQTLIWLGSLGGLMVVNEFLHDHLRVERLRLALFWLCTFSFLLFFIPVVLGYYGALLFVGALTLATVLSLGLSVFMYLGEGVDVMLQRGREHLATWAAVGLLVLGADALGLVPPVPFAVVDRGIFHEVAHTDEGYALTYEPGSWWRFWRRDEAVFHWAPGERAWCFTAIFAPTGAELDVDHVWEWQNPKNSLWVQTDRIPLDVRGGRAAGYRTYSRKARLREGDWRVRVVTHTGREIGRTTFEVVAVEAERVVERTTRIAH